MPRYFFNIRDHERDDDDEGAELPGPDAARVEAIKFAGEYLSNNPDLVRDDQKFTVDALDEGGRLLLHVEIVATRQDDEISQTAG